MGRTLRALLTGALLTAATAAGASDSEGRNTSLEVRQSHAFSRDEAKARVEQLLEYWQQRFGVKRRWEGDHVRVRGRFWGMEFKGVLVVRDDEVEALAEDPGTPLRRSAVDYVAGKLRKYLHPTYER